jgi:RNA polymerase sigma-70 factor (ECF subfamily)
VSATVPIPGVENDPEAATLGTVISVAAGGRAHPLEADWVALVHSIAAGDELAFRDLYGRMRGLVFILIARIVRDRHTAEELTLDVFHDVWKRAHSYDAAGGTVVGWVLNQARCRALDRTRFELRKKRVNPFPQTEAEAELGLVSCDTQLEGERREALLRAALVDLRPDEREAVELAFFAGCSYAEVAVRLRQPLGTVKTRIRSALKKLRHSLGPEV